MQQGTAARIGPPHSIGKSLFECIIQDYAVSDNLKRHGKICEGDSMAFADTLKTLPGVSHLAALILIDPGSGGVVHTIENKPGQIGSLTVYNHLAQKFGAITPEAARYGLELYGEHTDDARANPGKHPNVDRLISLSTGSHSLHVKTRPSGIA